MRLKQLEVIGLKSFANRTVLDFHPGVTAIVGPNGCGKSNVVDSIRWVLGEQSARHLRGDSMEDVIFKGNERLPAAGMAQVSLTFENDGTPQHNDPLDIEVSNLPEHFRNLTEITISRRYFRSGESEYFINKTPCRLKDITELFLGTGIGTRAYAMIEQGRVEQLINAKPEDRRLFIEEAAGTTLFRSRKLAAERKIERTKENLLRVSDVLRELERQIQYLQRLAKKAEQYRTLHAEFRALDLALSASQLQSLQQASADIAVRVEKLREDEQRLLTAQRTAESEIQQLQGEREMSEERVAELRALAAALGAERDSLNQRLELLARETQDRQRRAGRLSEEAQGLEGQRSKLGHEIENTSQLAATLEERLAQTQAAVQDDEQRLATLRTDATAINEAIEHLRARVVSEAAHESETRNQIASRERRVADLGSRLAKLHREMVDLDSQIAACDHGAAACRQDADAARRRLDQLEHEKRTRAATIQELAEARRHLTAEIDAHTHELGTARSQLESIRRLQQTYEGYQRGVRSILLAERPNDGVLGVVADVVSAPAEYERALAAALGEKLQYVIVREDSDGVGAVSTLRNDDTGRGSFIPLNPRVFSLNGQLRKTAEILKLLDVVRVEERFQPVAEALLGDVLLVPDLQTGLSLWRADDQRVTMVTPDGDVIDACGVITGGSERPLEEEIVTRRRVANELEERIAVVEAELARARAQADEKDRLLNDERASLQALDSGAHQLALDLVRIDKDLERADAGAQRARQQHELIVLEIGSGVAEHAEVSSQLVALGERLAAATRCGEQLRSELTEQQQQQARSNSLLDEQRARVADRRVRIAELSQQHHGAATSAEHLRQRLVEVEARVATILKDQAANAEELVRLRDETTSANALLQEKILAVEGVGRDTSSAQQELLQKAERLTTAEAHLRANREQVNGLREQLSQAQLHDTEHRMRAEHIIQAVAERHQVELQQEQPFSGSEEEQAQAKARVDTLRERLSRLGEVNSGAVEELSELEERSKFLHTQKQDLEQSIQDLERTIQRLNRESRTRFAETFAAVNEKFQSVLPRLFRGGEARLVLTDENNLLESGVDIVVKPPGKRLDTVTLLSGGEKALVAVSLIFSLFLTNPTPFCILDEVDAPLDDANIGRFTGLIKEMSQFTQFIVITHNKRTMEAAEVLYGVTMQEPGISKIISVATR